MSDHIPDAGKMVPDAWVDAALDAYSDNEWRTSASAMRAAINAVAPMIAAQERDRCIAIAQSEHGDAAQDIDMATRGCDETGRLQSEGAAHAAARIAAAIRVLGEAGR